MHIVGFGSTQWSSLNRIVQAVFLEIEFQMIGDGTHPVIPVIPVQRQCHVMSLVVGIQGQKAYGLCKTPLCAELVVQFSP